MTVVLSTRKPSWPTGLEFDMLTGEWRIGDQRIGLDDAMSLTYVESPAEPVGYLNPDDYAAPSGPRWGRGPAEPAWTEGEVFQPPAERVQATIRREPIGELLAFNPVMEMSPREPDVDLPDEYPADPDEPVVPDEDEPRRRPEFDPREAQSDDEEEGDEDVFTDGEGSI